jgi:hypothetical protein
MVVNDRREIHFIVCKENVLREMLSLTYYKHILMFKNNTENIHN